MSFGAGPVSYYLWSGNIFSNEVKSQPLDFLRESKVVFMMDNGFINIDIE